MKRKNIIPLDNGRNKNQSGTMPYQQELSLTDSFHHRDCNRRGQDRYRDSKTEQPDKTLLCPEFYRCQSQYIAPQTGHTCNHQYGGNYGQIPGAFLLLSGQFSGRFRLNYRVHRNLSSDTVFESERQTRYARPETLP